MVSARRFQLLSQARSVTFSKGEDIISPNQISTEVCMILSGGAYVFAELPGETEPIALEELGAGDCLGWVEAIAEAREVRAVANAEVQAMLVPVSAFLEIARYDPVLHQEMFSRVWKLEAWRAVLGEMGRREKSKASAREVVAHLLPYCVTCDWPEDEETVRTVRDRIWVVAGGEGVEPGESWQENDGVLWARLIGLPAEKFSRALAGEFSRPAKESVRTLPAASPAKTESPSRSSSPKRMEPPPPAAATAAPPASSRRRHAVWRVLVAVCVLVCAAGGAAAFWAARQPVSEPYRTSGTLVFTGERRTIIAGVAGKITEWNLHTGLRLERGSVIGIVQPPIDEPRMKALADVIVETRARAEYCEAIVSGHQLNPQGQPKVVADLALELFRLRSEQRVLSAVQRGEPNDPALTPAERRKANDFFAAVRADQAERVSSAVRDTGARREELRDAEAELREAQAELNSQIKTFADVGNDKSEEAQQERAAAQKALALARRIVAARQDAVNRLRKEIAGMSAETDPAPTASESAAALLTGVTEQVDNLENRLRQQAVDFRRIMAADEALLAKLQADSAPRQIEALQAGLVLEAAPLAVGSSVQTDTMLARLTTRQAWELEPNLASADIPRLRTGQDFSIVSESLDGGTSRVQERLVFISNSSEHPKWRVLSSRDEWRDGTPVQIETVVVTGTLLDAWLAQIRKTLRI